MPNRLSLQIAPHGTSLEAPIDAAVIAGWTGRDRASVEHHIAELAAIGVPRPSSVPLFYRVAASQLTTSAEIEVLGDDTSGEVEPVLLGIAGRLYVGIGSDHTDRKAEAYSVAVSKQLCSKPIGRQVWLFSELADHWDRLELKSWAVSGEERTLYQHGLLGEIRDPRDLIARYAGGDSLPDGTIMFCGTLPAIGGVRPAPAFAMELTDPVLGQTLSHAYRIGALPLVR